jgi:hypothetical protein
VDSTKLAVLPLFPPIPPLVFRFVGLFDRSSPPRVVVQSFSAPSSFRVVRCGRALVSEEGSKEGRDARGKGGSGKREGRKRTYCCSLRCFPADPSMLLVYKSKREKE